MNKISLLLLVGVLGSQLAIAQWRPVGNKIKTKWASEISPEKMLSEYPRPIMERDDGKNFNG